MTNGGLLSLGRDRKRLISAQVHHATLGKLEGTQLAELAGQLAFANVVEPTFLARLTEKYGLEAIDRIKAWGGK